MQEIGQQAARGSCYRFLPTLETTLLTVLMAAAWPGLMWYSAGGLRSRRRPSELCKAAGLGLIETARVFLALELLRQHAAVGGLGESHFGWSAAALKAGAAEHPLVQSAGAAADVRGGGHGLARATTLGRLAGTNVFYRGPVVLFAGCCTGFFARGSVVFQAMIAARRGGWLERFRYVWYPLCVLTPAALAVLAAAGYHYTARQLVIRLILTAYVLVGGVVCRALLLRWTLVNQRKLAIEQARQRARPLSRKTPPARSLRPADCRPRPTPRTRSGHDQHPDPPPDRIFVGRGVCLGCCGVPGSTCCRPWAAQWRSLADDCQR